MQKIAKKDDIAQINLELTKIAVENEQYGKPYLDLDLKAYKDYRNGKLAMLPELDNDLLIKMMIDKVQSKEVLLLAGGGGQQSAIFSLLGAKVTVFDLTQEQLELDRVAAEHYGYDITLIQGDMRDMSVLPSDHYHRVFQPISSLYVPDMRIIYRSVARILKNGGLYYSDYCYSPLYMAETIGWDGEAFVMRFSQPNISGRILERESDGVMNFTEGKFYGEFNHLFSDIINGQISEGLCIVELQESPRFNTYKDVKLIPGSQKHKDNILPYGISIVSRCIK
jgi:SAM-dependent methyltransferase